MNQTVLITGSSAGIGAATARLLALKGCNVIATLRDPSKADELAAIPNVLVTRLDVQDPASIRSALKAGIGRFGRIHALINNAGYGQYGLFEAIAREKIQQQFDVNLFGVMDVTRAILPHMRRQGGGVIVNVSSGGGIFTLPMISLYCASKFALEGFSESLSYELASQGIIVKLVVPHGGVTNTQFGQRSSQDLASDASLSDYEPFVARTTEAFSRMVAARSVSAEDVAQVIFECITDGSDQLRYFVGNDARGFLKAKRELADQQYVEFMRAKFRGA